MALSKTSAEPARTAAYSSDIGWRVVWQRAGMGLSFRDIATRLQIGLSTAHRMYKKFEETGEVAPIKPGPRPDLHKLDEIHELYILGLLVENPGLYLKELCQYIYTATGTTVSGSTVCRVLQKNGLTRKKIVHIAKQRCIEYRGKFMAEILQYPPEWFVFLDETGADHKDHIRKFGYSLIGEPPVYHRFLGRGTRISAIAALSTEGLACYELITGTTNGEKLYDFIRGSLIPTMQPFPGKMSILIMDNCSIHHVQEVKDLLEAAGILLIFLPPYSPDYNPFEELFSYIKYYLKDHDDLIQSTSSSSLRDVLNAAFQSVTADFCKAYIRDCGY